MAEARRREEWQHTSLVTAAIVNSQFGRKNPVSPEKFNPFKYKQGGDVDRIDVGIKILKNLVPKHLRGKVRKMKAGSGKCRSD